MIFSFVFWVLGMYVLDGDNSREALCWIMAFSGIIEWALYFCVIGTYLGWGS